MTKFGNSETDITVQESTACREIVLEIMKFGVKEQQLLKIIYLLSLELSGRDALVEISTSANNFINNLTDGENLSQSKIIA